MTQETFRVSTIEAVSPTLAETLRLCKLRAGLSRSEGTGRYILGNPKAWLGTAYHAVMERIGLENNDDIDASVSEVWGITIKAQYDRSRAHPLDKRFGPPESWPGYHMVAAIALVRAKEMVAMTSAKSGACGNYRPVGKMFREKKFSGLNGKLIGRPDVVGPNEIVDFKTGELFEDEEQEQVKTAYVRQLRLYAFLVKEALGRWPRRGVLLPLVGSPIIVTLEADECEAEAIKAVNLLDEYNALISHTRTPVDLASPSPSNCRWCQYQLYCPAFWSAVSPGWESGLHGAVVEGIATGPVSPIYAGMAFSISIQLERGTLPAGVQISLFPLQCSVHDGIEKIQTGDRLRAIGLLCRADGSLVPSIRTMIAGEARMPLVLITP